jgi:hypothetical protein
LEKFLLLTEVRISNFPGDHREFECRTKQEESWQKSVDTKISLAWPIIHYFLNKIKSSVSHCYDMKDKGETD